MCQLLFVLRIANTFSYQNNEIKAGAELCQAHASLDLSGFHWIFDYFDCLTGLIHTDFVGIWNKKIFKQKYFGTKNMLVQKIFYQKKFNQKTILVR